MLRPLSGGDGMGVGHLVAALLLGSIALPAAGQDARSLVDKNLEARGGAAALAAIRNVSFEGRTIYPGDFELAYKETRARVGAAAADRVDLNLQGLDIVQAYDGHSAWKVDPTQGRKDAEKMSADEARELADAALIEGPLLSSRTDGSSVAYLGREDFDGTLAYKLKVTQKDGDEFVYWLDPDTYLEIKIAETRRIRGAEQTNETELGDYEKIAGVYFPMSVETWPQGQDSNRSRTIIETGVANTELAPDYFAEPGTSAAKVVAAAAAKPKVTPSRPTRRVSRLAKPGKGE